MTSGPSSVAPRVLIVGQGLAGSALARALDLRNVDWRMADQGHASAASRIGAGIINPITGQRLVKSPEFADLLPVARAFYQTWETEWAETWWRDMRVDRRFRGENEAKIYARKRVTGELSPFMGACQPGGFWIEGAARVDIPQLIAAARCRWLKQGRMQAESVDRRKPPAGFAVVVWCTGAAGWPPPEGEGSWARAKGEVLRLRVPGLASNVIRNQGHWLLPTQGDEAWIGATYSRDAAEAKPTMEGREELVQAARVLEVKRPEVLAHLAGWRVTTPDRQPRAGFDPRHPHEAYINGLGSKGALWAPHVAQTLADKILSYLGQIDK